MRPLSLRWPKPALPFLNRPLLHWILDEIEAAGIQEVLLNLHHRPSAVVRAGGSRTGSVRLRWFFEPALLGTAGPLPSMGDALGEEPFLVLNSDTLFRPPFEAMRADLVAHPEALCVMALRPLAGSYTAVALDEDGAIRDFGRGNHHFAGAYLARPALFEALPKGVPAELVPRVLVPRLPSGRIRGIPVSGPWLDLGDPAGFLDAAMRVLGAMVSGQVRPPEGSRLEVRDGFPVLLHPTAWVSRRASLTGPAVLEAGAVLCPRSRAGRAVLFPGTGITAGGVLEGALAWPGGAAGVS
jgi:mannose-1-phosphate guanylyltransferase